MEAQAISQIQAILSPLQVSQTVTPSQQPVTAKPQIRATEVPKLQTSYQEEEVPVLSEEQLIMTLGGIWLHNLFYGRALSSP